MDCVFCNGLCFLQCDWQLENSPLKPIDINREQAVVTKPSLVGGLGTRQGTGGCHQTLSRGWSGNETNFFNHLKRLFVVIKRKLLRLSSHKLMMSTLHSWVFLIMQVRSWKHKLPLNTVLRVLQVLVPQVEKLCIDTSVMSSFFLSFPPSLLHCSLLSSSSLVYSSPSFPSILPCISLFRTNSPLFSSFPHSSSPLPLSLCVELISPTTVLWRK